MASKRMFSKALLETDAFMDMPMPTKALYFLLGMEADDEGFVSPKRVMRIYGGNDDDLRVLIAKNFVIQFESGVIVITDWRENNYLDKKRIKETKYENEKNLLGLENKKYKLLSGKEKPVKQKLNKCLTTVKQKLNQSRVEENRIDKNSIVIGGVKGGIETPTQKTKRFFEDPKPIIEFLIIKKKMEKKFVEETILEFISYWTEPTKSGKKQRWQLQPTFEVLRRLATWFRKSDQFKKSEYKKGLDFAIIN